MTDGREEIEAAEDAYWQAVGRYTDARAEREDPGRIAELRAEAEAADVYSAAMQLRYPEAWAEMEDERSYEARQDAILGTEAEQNAEAVIDEAESILSAELGRYELDTYIIPGPEPPEPEAE